MANWGTSSENYERESWKIEDDEEKQIPGAVVVGVPMAEVEGGSIHHNHTIYYLLFFVFLPILKMIAEMEKEKNGS